MVTQKQVSQLETNESLYVQEVQLIDFGNFKPQLHIVTKIISFYEKKRAQGWKH